MNLSNFLPIARGDDPAELRRIAEEVSARAALSEDEAAVLVDEAIRATRRD